MDVARGYPYHPHNDEKMVTTLSAGKEVLLTFVWLTCAVLVAAAAVYRSGNFECVNMLKILTLDNAAVSTINDSKEKTLGNNGAGPLTREDPVDLGDAYNMFNPADLPPRLAEYANMVYSACEDLGNFFGFQDSSVRNQAEHLLILLSNNRRYMSSHILPPSVQPPSPIHALHAKVFSNYVKWCRAMGVAPHFSKMNTSMNAPPAVASRVVDLVLFFCIWGEGANLRHMSECVWFLYHKMMEEHILSEGYTQARSLYAGHYLDHVVTPIYNVVGKVRYSVTSVRNAISISYNFFLLDTEHEIEG
jgi:callose synthase